MLIYVPMSGFGTRYLKAGYTDPKPLIPVDGKPMIERVIEAFPGEERFIFTVNRQHAEETDVLDVLERLRPGSKKVVIEPHKDGPVRTLLDSEHELPDDEPILVNYCDFGVDWDYQGFLKFIEDGQWDGALTGYVGFHPHTIGPTMYAYMRNDGDHVLEIKEKGHFTDDRFSEYASAGLYWFRRGADLKRFAHQLVDSGERIQNEFFVSVVQQLQIESGQRVGLYELDHFYQWGTPLDLQDWESWARAMRKVDGFLGDVGRTTMKSAQVLPMAGLGKRFSDEGYEDPKPLIDVLGAPMIERAMQFLPKPSRRILVARKEHASDERFRAVTAQLDPPAEVVEIEAVTEGQACTALLGVEKLDPKTPVLIPPCDAGYLFEPAAVVAEERSGEADCIVWCARNYLPSIWYPPLSGWIHADWETGVAKAMAVKKLVDGVDQSEQGALTGTFWFKEAGVFVEETKKMIAADDRVNGEFYIDTLARRMIEAGYVVKAFVVDKFMPWGTPKELKTFLYWNEVHRGAKNLAGRKSVVNKSIVVPCYNEAKNLPTVFERFEALRDASSDWTLILVDNGSTDDSAAVFEAELAKPNRSFVKLVRVPSPNVGYGHGIFTGLKAAETPFLAWTHADGQTPPGDVLSAFSLLTNAADPERTFVKGRRRNRPLKDAAFTFGMTAAATALLGEDLSDVNAQPKAFHRSLLDLAVDPPTDLSFDLYFFFLARKHGYEVKTFDVSFLDREHGESKWAFNWRSKAKNVQRSLNYMAALRRDR